MNDLSGGMFGTRLGALAGMPASPQSLTRSVRGQLFAATRIVCPPNSSRVRVPPERAYILSVQLKSLRRRELCVDGKPSAQTSLPRGTVTFYDLSTDIECRGHSGLDSLHLYLPQDSFDDNYIHRSLGPRGLNLSTGTPIQDPTIRFLAQSLMPTLERPGAGDDTFIEEIALALRAHLIRAYWKPEPGLQLMRGGLAPWQQRRAQEMLAADFTARIGLADIAKDCGLSVGHFIRAFSECVGETPHRWLLRQRIEYAKARLGEGRRSLAEIALDCGFSDQSHFTRLFTRQTGTPPGTWRRMNCNPSIVYPAHGGQMRQPLG